MLEQMEQYETAETMRELVPGQVSMEIMGQREYKETAEVSEISGLFGNPEAAAEVWHYQGHLNSCAVVAQEFIAEELLGKEFSEVKMRAYAADREWFNDDGTILGNVGLLLEEMGLDVEREFFADISDMKQVLAEGGKIMAGVNNMTLESRLFGLLPDSNVNHIVEVTGIDERDPKHPKVILNDSGVPDGAARVVDMKTFLAAWKKSDNFMVSVYRGKGGNAE